MPVLARREFLLAGSAFAGGMVAAQNSSQVMADSSRIALKIAAFRFDVTPPLGHSLCGGWIPPANRIEDTLEAIGFVLLGQGKPIVICSVDWTGLLNEAHLAWRVALAEAAGTTADRVAVQCVHQHDAPFVCLEAEKIVAAQGDLPHMVDLAFFEACLQSGRSAVQKAIESAVEVTSVSHAQALVDRVASNRRIVDLNGKVVSQRGSSSKDPSHHRYPEGLIDPYLKTVAFYHQAKMVVACHYYACHPMSYYGRGEVSSDFCGLARKQLQSQTPDCTQIYFNGCGGNIGAGKYNDGTPEARIMLTQRMLDGMQRSLDSLQPQPIESCDWITREILPPPRSEFDHEQLLAQVADRNRSVVDRNRPAFILSWINRYRSGLPIVLAALHVNNIALLHLPSECYVEYQLRAQATQPEKFIACAAYGDGGPWYIPVREAYPQGGYSVGVAWCTPDIDTILSAGMASLLTPT